MSSNLTYTQFLDQVYKPGASSNICDQNLIVNRFRSRDIPATNYSAVSFLLDFVTRKYLYVDESCFALVGYTVSYFMKHGLDDYRSKWHALDKKLVDEKIFPVNLSFLEKIPVEKYQDYVFSYNYRVMNAAGNYVNLIQRFSFLHGESISGPVGIIGIVFDITHYKKANSIVHTIEQCYDGDAYGSGRVVYKKIHPVCHETAVPVISKRELQILSYVADGLSSKRIAEMLQLSVNTVNNHRKTMLNKNGCENTSELISLSIRNGLL